MSWSACNVSQWLNNDEGLYNAMRYCVRTTRNRKEAAQKMVDEFLPAETPDGARYTVTSVREAMVGID